MKQETITADFQGVKPVASENSCELTQHEYDLVSYKATLQAQKFTGEIMLILENCPQSERLKLTQKMVFDMLYNQYFSEARRAAISPKIRERLISDLLAGLIKEASPCTPMK